MELKERKHLKEKTVKKEKSRIEVRINRKDKLYFEQVALTGHYKNFSAFVLDAIKDKAQEIEKQNRVLLATQRDREIFSNLLLNPPAPNAELKKAFDFNQDFMNH